MKSKRFFKTQNLRDTFSIRIFQMGFDSLDFYKRWFIYDHIRNYLLKYRFPIADKFLPIVTRKNFKDRENKQMIEWYLDFIPLIVILKCIDLANAWIKREGGQFTSLRLIRNSFVPNQLKLYLKQTSYLKVGSHKSEFTNNNQDPYMYQAWYDFYFMNQYKNCHWDFFQGIC